MTKQERLQEIEEIKQWLKDHDYVVIKYVLGEYEYDATTYCKYLDDRVVKKARLKFLVGG